ncbi:iron transporter [Dermabacteraceae bacterium TAE3-ERU5]|nr:iron transporter [Dermabacteraceae bacterium TAE3-ERU5]
MTTPRMNRRSVLGLGATMLLLAGCDNAKKEADKMEKKAAADKKEEGGEKKGEEGDPRLKESTCGTKDDDGGAHEIPVGEAEEGPFKMEVNYFQPAYMLPGTADMMPSYKESLCHLEMDIKANKEGVKYGWTLDETPAGLNITYKVLDESGKEIISGLFMEMNAGDGSHYGTNVPLTAQENGLVGTLQKPGKFTLVFNIAPPKGYGLHGDARTKVEVDGWFKPFDVKMEWLYTGEQLKCKAEDPTAPIKKG